MRPLGLALLVALLVGCAQAVSVPSSPAPGAALRLAIMPLEDFGEDVGGSFQVRGALEQQLAGRGYKVVDEARLRRLLLRERVRRPGAVGLALGRTIGKEMDAPVLLLGAVTQYRAGGDSPCVSLVARMVEAHTGRLLWTGAASGSGRQFETVLGLGNIRDASKLVAIEVRALLSSLPPAATLAARIASPAPEEVGAP